MPLGSSTPDIAYIVNPPGWPENETGHACGYQEQEFISHIHEMAQVDIIAHGYDPLTFCIIPIVGCSAQALQKAGKSITDVRCYDRVRRFIDNFGVALTVAMSKDLGALSNADLSISGMYAISKLNSSDAEKRIGVDVLKIRQQIAVKWAITLVEESRPTSLRKF